MEKGKSFRKFMILWAGEFVSAIGSGLTSFGLGVYAYQQTKSAAAVALISLFAFLPSILLSPFAGVLADRIDRRLLMIIGDGCSALGLLYIFICMLFGQATIVQICIGVTISSIFAALLEPAYKATITELLTEEQYSKAGGLVQVAGSSKYLFSPILAGMLLRVADIKVLLIIDMATFFLTVIATCVVRNGMENKKRIVKAGMWDDFKEGWAAITKKKGVAVIVLLMTFVTFFLGFIQTLLTPLVLSFTDSATLGTMETVCACGMLVSSVLMGFLSIKKHYVKLMAIGLATTGLFMAMTGIRANLMIMGIGGFLFFASLPIVNITADCLIRMSIEEEVQGRAWGLIGIISQLGYVFAYGLSGFLADHVFEPMLASDGILADSVGRLIGTGTGRGIGFSLIIGGVLIIVTAAIFYHNKEVRRLEEHYVS